MDEEQNNNSKENKFAPNYKVIEGFVKFCPCCGRTWEATGSTGEEINCGWEDCQQKFRVLKL